MIEPPGRPSVIRRFANFSPRHGTLAVPPDGSTVAQY